MGNKVASLNPTHTLKIFNKTFFSKHFFCFSQITPQDFDAICKFTAKLSESYKKSNLTLTLTVEITNAFDSNKFDLFKLSESFDYLNIVQLYGNLGEKISFAEASKTRELANIQLNLKNITGSGILPNKTTFGVLLTGLHLTPKAPGSKRLQFSGYESYNRICMRYTDKKTADQWVRSQDDSGLALLKNKKTVESFYYESTRTVANLVRFAVKEGLAGVITNEITEDDYAGACTDDTDTFEDFKVKDGIKLDIPTRNETDFPILRAINDAIVVTFDEIEKSGASQIVISAFCIIFVSFGAFVSSSIYV